jgi:hypothetical protein
MKLRKQTPLKAAVVAVIAALLGGFYALVHSQPHVKAEQAPQPPPVDYGRFFAPNQPSGGQPPVSQPAPHTRTRAS